MFQITNQLWKWCYNEDPNDGLSNVSNVSNVKFKETKKKKRVSMKSDEGTTSRCEG